MKLQTRKIVTAAMFASLICVATMIIKIPSPLNGYINLGDSILLLAAWLLPPAYGALAAGIGSSLADLFLGYGSYAVATFIIKALMSLSAYFSYKLLHKKTGIMPALILSSTLAEILMVAGYYLYEGILLYGFVSSAVNIPANAVQGFAGIVIGTLLYKILNKNKLFK